MEDQDKAAQAAGENAPVAIRGKGQEITVALVPLDSKFADLIRGWRNHPAISRWCRQNNLITDMDQAEWLRKQNGDPRIRMYLIWAKTDEAENPVGVCGLTDIDLVSRRAEFSLYIAPGMHGRGLGKAALGLLFDKGFDDLGLNVIWGETFDGNPAMRCWDRLGLVKEGTRRDFYFKEGRFVDAHLVSVKADEWRKRRATA